MSSSSSSVIATSTSGDSRTFRFRRYREEAALRSSRQKNTDGSMLLRDDKDEHDASTADTIEHTTTTKTMQIMPKDEGDDDGAVLQNMSDAVIVINAQGKVLIEKITKKNSSDTKSIESDNDDFLTEEDENERRQPVSVVPEGTTLLLRNLRDCRVTM